MMAPDQAASMQILSETEYSDAPEDSAKKSKSTHLGSTNRDSE